MRVAGFVALTVLSATALLAPVPDPAPETLLVVALADDATVADLDAGRVVDEFDQLGVATVAATSADEATLRRDPDVVALSPDQTLTPAGASWGGASWGTYTGHTDDTGRRQGSGGHELGLQEAWSHGWTGRGQTVALIDTGVTAHPDLAGRLVHGPNFSGDDTTDDLYGHGTPMAGLIAGDGTASDGQWVGAAPEATVLSVKVASASGAADVSQILAAMQWVVSWRNTYSTDVLALAYNTDGTQSATVDPLAFAVQRATDAGIVVVAASGNFGSDGTAGTVGSVGAAPAAITVGAADPSTMGLAAFTGLGPTVDGVAKPEVFAPGVDIVAPAAMGSQIVASHPDAVRGDLPYVRGSGTSQAAALTAGMAAIVTQRMGAGVSPALVKGRLAQMGTTPLAGHPGTLLTWRSGGGNPPQPPAVRGDGSGSLHDARGTMIVEYDGVPLTGEVTAWGDEWDGASWGATTWDEASWSGASWGGASWGGASWGGASWGGASWGGASWGGASWGGASWGGASWGSSMWN